jgi:predicted secreted Zn-dependent protease
MAQVDKSGPLGADGKHHAGRTRWDIQWKLRSEQQGSACTIKDVAVALGIAQTFPKWRGEDKSAPGLKAGWSKFKAALQRHEDAHKQHGIQAAKDIEAGIRAVKSASNCEAVEAAANAQAHAIITKYQALDETYDRDTDYGHSEGVTLF